MSRNQKSPVLDSGAASTSTSCVQRCLLDGSAVGTPFPADIDEVAALYDDELRVLVDELLRVLVGHAYTTVGLTKSA